MKVDVKSYMAAAKATTVDTAAGRVFWKQRPRRDFHSHSTWMAWNTRHAGKEAGLSGSAHTGRAFKLGGANITVARLVARAAWGRKVDSKFIEHINGDKFDCRLENLRLINGTQRREKSQRADGRQKGVYPRNSKTGMKYHAYRRIKGKLKFLGIFDTEEAAAAAFRKAGGQ